MDKNRDPRGAAVDDGLIFKAAGLETQEVTAEELKAINKLTLSPLAAEDVFTFKAVLCDNDLDRQYEQFSPKALKDLQKLFLGKTVIKDHNPRADNQVARIYATEVVDTGKLLKSGEPYLQLQARCYMVKTAGNADLITEIKGGIKKEGSVGFRVSSSICSICGTDNAKDYCRHWPGRSYDKEGGKQVCTFKLDGVSDAYEFSLVAVPAQRAAGACKNYTGVPVYPEADPEPTAASSAEKAHGHELNLRARLLTQRTHINTYNE